MTELLFIAEVTALPSRILRIVWTNDHETLVDLTGVIADFPPFTLLAVPAVFATVTVAGYGSGAAWRDGLTAPIVFNN